MKKLKFFVFIVFIACAFIFFGVLNYYFPFKYESIIRHYAQVHGVDPVLIASIINVESRFDRYAVSHAGASGLMQLMPGTAQWAAEEIGIPYFDFYEMVFDPYININIGTWYFSRLLGNHATQEVALAAYNAGSGNVSSWLSNPNFSYDGEVLNYIPFGETRRYVSRVNISTYVYRVIMWVR